MTNPINVYPMQDSAILWINAKRPHIEVDPAYQREGDVWTLEKRQLLVDSLLNGFDLPKLYFHRFAKPKEKGQQKSIQYAIIDGRQRLETIWHFVDDKFSLAEDFKFYEDPAVKAGGLTYSDLAREYPSLKMRFDARTLPVMLVETEDIDLIEEMFSRLNEAVPLNAAEKRNALGGPMAKAIRDVSDHSFFKGCIPFTNKRYQHREVAVKFLYLAEKNAIADTKKIYLDQFVKDYRGKSVRTVTPVVRSVGAVLDRMKAIFSVADPLLRSQSMVVIYFLIFQRCGQEKWFPRLTRKSFIEFEKSRDENRSKASADISTAKYELLEFDRLALQGTNDALSIQFRFDKLREYLEHQSR